MLIRSNPVTRIFALFLCLALAACGFHLRGQSSLPFDTLFVVAAETSGFAAELKRAIRYGSHTELTDTPESAQAVLRILSEAREKKILSLNSAGRVREFELHYRVSFKLSDNKNKDWISSDEIALKRDFTFNDEQVLAKESEEALLYRDMQNDAVQQMLRKLSAVKNDS